MWLPDQRVKSTKCGGNTSSGSVDMTYFNLYCKKKDIYDYLMTTCDNSNSQAFLTYFVLQSAAKEFYYKV